MNKTADDRTAAGVPPELSAAEFDQIRRLAHSKFGLELRHGKEALVSARLGKKMRELKCRSFREYYEHVLEDRTGEALVAMIDALTTNYTNFFREPAHFSFLRETILPGWRGHQNIRAWSAACATGEEPYSLAFFLLEELGREAAGRVSILATDISTRALQNAERGRYPEKRLDGLPTALCRSYLLRGHGRAEGWYCVKPEVRAMLQVRRLNLVEDFAWVGTFPLIFCRNVMIYFNKETQQDVVARLTARLEPGGYLFIGHSESLTGIRHELQYVRPAIYRKPAGNAPRRDARR